MSDLATPWTAAYQAPLSIGLPSIAKDTWKFIELNQVLPKTVLFKTDFGSELPMGLVENIDAKKGSPKECSNYCTIALISHANKVMLKILQARHQQYVNCELPDVQASFIKGRGTRDQSANILWIIKKSKRVP